MSRWCRVDACHGQHQVGDWHWRIGQPDTVLTHTGWATVCPRDRVPMLARVGIGYLACGACGLLVVDVPRRTVPPAGCSS